MKKKHIPIFMAADDAYLPYLTVAIKSISMHSTSANSYDIRILTSGLLPQNIRKLRHMSLPNITIRIVDMNERIAQHRERMSTRLRDYYSEAIYYRIFIARMYPRLAKAIYIDSDVVLNSDIAELYATPLGKSLIGAVTDETIVLLREFSEYARKWVGVEPHEYINSGVMVMNLKQMRKEGFEEKFTELLTKYNFDTIAPDQDYFNHICKGRISYLPAVWNKQPKAETPTPLSDVKLIHYNLNLKPWHYREIPYADRFWQIAMLTGVYDYIVEEFKGFTEQRRLEEKRDNERLVARAVLLSRSRGGFASIDRDGERGRAAECV